MAVLVAVPWPVKLIALGAFLVLYFLYWLVAAFVRGVVDGGY